MNFEQGLLEYLLLEKIKHSQFKKIEIREEQENAIGVHLEGEPFGLISGLITGVKAVSENCGIPIDHIVKIISIGAQMAEQVSAVDLEEQSNTPELFKMFEDYVKNDLNKEGEQ